MSDKTIDVTSAEFRKLPASERIQRLRQRANPYDDPRVWEPNPHAFYGQKSKPPKRDV